MTSVELDAIAAGLAPVVKDLIAPLLARLADLEQRMATFRNGVDGKDGKDGKDGIDGKDGEPGKQGEMGLTGPEGVPGKDAELPDLQAIAKAAAAFVPVPRDGLPGVPGASGRDGKDGLNGKDGEKGSDGLGFDDMDEEWEDDRTVIRRYRRGDQVKEFRHTFPVLLDRGVWQPGRIYEKGDGVTWAGSFWIAQESTSAKPGESGLQSRAWRLAVKKGADGKVGPAGPEGKMGLKGDQGPAGPARY